MIIYEDTYTTKLGTEFKFAFDLEAEAIEIIILEQPSYGDRSEANHITHRNRSGDGFKICWSRKLRTLAEAKTVAGQWASLTEAYILTGEPFPS